MPWLKLVPVWLWVALAGVLLVGAQQIRISIAKADASNVRSELAEYRAEVSEAGRLAEAQARSEEQRRQAAIEGIRKDAQSKITQANADAASADSSSKRLREQLAKFASTAASYTGTSDRGKAISDPVGLLSGVLIDMESTGRAIAEEADRRRLAGEACEAAYDAL